MIIYEFLDKLELKRYIFENLQIWGTTFIFQKFNNCIEQDIKYLIADFSWINGQIKKLNKIIVLILI